MLVLSLNTSVTVGFLFSTIASTATRGLCNCALCLCFILTALNYCYVNAGLNQLKNPKKAFRPWLSPLEHLTVKGADGTSKSRAPGTVAV